MVVTFYSYKGGVGRTQLLANVAVGLANRGFDLIMVDMDLESPGLHSYFHPVGASGRDRRLSDQDLADRSGLIDILIERWEGGEEAPDLLNLLVPVDHPNRSNGKGRLRLLPPGRLDERYPQRVTTFPWEQFYAQAHGYAFMEYVRRTLLEGDDHHRGADLVLIDSRTGLTDVGSICTGQMPDVLVVLFALHVQGIEGARQIARAVDSYQRAEGENARLRRVLLLPSRVDEDGSLPERDAMLDYAASHLFGQGDLLADLEDRLPYDPRIAYGEPVIVGSESKPTNLSRAYERFIDRLIETADLNVADTDDNGKTEESQPPAPLQLFDAAGRLEQAAARISSDWQRIVEGNLDELPLHTQQLIDTTHAARLRCEHAIETARALAGNRESETLPMELPEKFPQRAADWVSLATKVRENADRIGNAWVQNWGQWARQRLTEAAGGQSPDIEDRLAALLEAARTESLASLKMQLLEAEQYLRRNSLYRRLDKRELGDEELARVIKDNTARRQWIEERLTRLQEESDLADPSVKNQLWNSLRLLTALLSADPNAPKRPDQAHWSAYDVLCMLTAPEGEAGFEEDQRCFDQIGVRLWQSEWEGLVAGDRLGDSEWPCGLEARKQLRRMSETKPDSLDALVGLVSDALGQELRSSSTLLRLIENRRGDPVVELAILAVGANRGAANRLVALGCWLHVCKPQRTNQALVAFLNALAEDGYQAEAFFGACACLAGFSQVDGHYSTVWSDLATRFVVLLLRKGRVSKLVPLLLDSEFTRVLSHGRAGLGLAAFLAGFSDDRIDIEADALALLRATVLHSDRRSRLPEPTAQWLESVEQGRVCCAGDLERTRIQAQEARNRMNITVYKKWDCAVYFEKAFVEHWNEVYRHLIQGGRPLSDSRRELWEEDAEDWIEKTFNELRAQGKHISLPERTARRNLLDAHASIAQALKEMLETCPAGWSVQQALDQIECRDEGYRALKAWIGQSATTDVVTVEREVAEILGNGQP